MFARLRSLIRGLRRRGQVEGDMDREIRFHVEAYATSLERSGVSREEAERRARIEFGSSERAKQECREARGLSLPDEFARNVRYSLRLLRRSPGFALTAILTLGLCIGANTAIFSVIDAVLLRPLPYPEPERLAEVVRRVRTNAGEGMNSGQDGRTFETLRDHATRFDVAARGGSFSGVNLATKAGAEYVSHERVSSGFFRLLGVAPFIGREFTAEEDRAGGAQVTILSYKLWQRLFREDASVLNQTVLLRGEPHVVVGIMPSDFRDVARADLWTPLRPSTKGEGSGANYQIVARSRPGATIGEADSETASLGERVMEMEGTRPGVSVRLGLVSLQDGLGRGVRQPLVILWSAVGAVLLIGCVNVAGLLLARSSRRTREMATRAALGGGRGAVVRQLLAESLVIGALGGCAGLVLGFGGITWLAGIAFENFGVWQEIRFDARVFLLTLGLSFLTSMVFGLLPALESFRVDIRTGLSEGGNRAVVGQRSRWRMRFLVLGEVALGVVLLVGAGLLIRTFLHLRHLSPGFDGANVISASISLQDARYKTSAQVNRLFDETLARISAQPGVETAAVGLHVPYQRWLNMGSRRVLGNNPEEKPSTTNANYVTPKYFDALRIPVLAGRIFDDHDLANSRPVAIVNDEFARRYAKDENPVGTFVTLGGDKQPREVVGVVGSIQQRPSFGNAGPLGKMPTIFIPAAQASDGFMGVHIWFAPSWIVRTAGPRDGVIAGMRRAVEQTDPLLPFASFRHLDELRDRTIAFHRLQATLLGVLAGLALLLAAIGIYGLIANSVTERVREMGIRMALGATPRQAVVTAAAPGIVLSVAGVLLGTGLALGVVRLIRTAFWGVEATDPITYGTVAAGLLAVATLASVIPALRLLRVNPADTLRSE